MEKEVKDTSNIIKKWGLGGILALAGIIIIIIVRIENIPVLERRMQNKIEIQEQHEEQLDQHHIDFLLYQLEQKDIEIQRLHEYYELKIEIEILKAKQ